MHRPTRSGRDAFLQIFVLLAFLLVAPATYASNQLADGIPIGLMQAFQQAQHQVEAGEDGVFHAANPSNSQQYHFFQITSKFLLRIRVGPGVWS